MTSRKPTKARMRKLPATGVTDVTEKQTAAPRFAPAQADTKPGKRYPTKAELEEEFDMPGLSEDELRERFLRLKPRR